ncbi:tryptophan synthase alpha chain [Striga asiatica]|uniref:Tryptophan synthase alpha chain n=1 Tax=Striga asiatica TaxID=4170 RepID=A0A5A7QKL0_STRAF|nr:tryptophan synthase alpha chain [Striga asiatica]
MINYGQPYLLTISPTFCQTFPKLTYDFLVGIDREGQVDNNDRAPGTGNISLDGLLDGLESAVEHDNSIALLEAALGKGPTNMLKNNGGGCGGVVHYGNLVNVVGINEILDDGAGMEDLALEVIHEEIVGLAEEAELPPLLGGDDGGRAASEAAVVDSGDAGLVVGELLPNFGIGYEGGFELLGDVVVVAVGGGARVLEAGHRIHGGG